VLIAKMPYSQHFNIFVNYKLANKLECWFVVRPFQSGLMFASKARAYLRVEHLKGTSPGFALAISLTLD
jgi:hypothetical protein